MLKLQKALHRDAINLAPKLREIDKLEVECLGHTPEAGLLSGFSLPNAVMLSAFNPNNEIILMCGVSDCPTNSKAGVIWMLASNEIQQHKRDILKLSKSTLILLSNNYDYVYNFVHKDNKTSIRWLQWCGFTVDKSNTYKQGGEDFYLLIKES